MVRWPIQIEELRSDFGDDSLLGTARHDRTLRNTTEHYWTLLDTDSISYPFLIGPSYIHPQLAGFEN